MNPSVRSSRALSLRALTLTLAMAFFAWALYVAGQYGELVNIVRDEVWAGTTEHVTFTQFFTVAAIAVLGLGALIAKRMLAKVRASDQPVSALARPVVAFANVLIVVAAALAALVVTALAFGGLFGFESEPAPLARLVNIYIPIILYTALVLVLILGGFVFSPSPARPVNTAATHTPVQNGAAVRNPLAADADSKHVTPVGDDAGAGDSAGATHEQTGAPEALAQEQQPAQQEQPERLAPEKDVSRRSTAMAYTTPIVATAVALILGLIVYDFTRSAPQAWIWVLIFAIVGAGVIIGTVLARRSERASRPVPSVVSGAKYLNFVLSIVFVVVAGSTSMGYGSAAVHGLNIAPSLWANVYDERGEYVEPTDGRSELENPQFYVNGYDLAEGSDVTLTLEPSGTELEPIPVDYQGWTDAERTLPAELDAGDYELVVHGTTKDYREIEVTIDFSINEQGTAVFENGTEEVFETVQNRLVPVSFGWIMGDLVPAGVLALLGLGVAAATLTVRNRDA